MTEKENLSKLIEEAIKYAMSQPDDDNRVVLRCEDAAEHLINNGVRTREIFGCRYCREYADLPKHFEGDVAVGRVFDTCIQQDENGRWHIEHLSSHDIGIQYCPMCGRKLPTELEY